MGGVDPLLELSTSLRKIKSPVFVPNIYGVHVYNTRIVLPSKITTLETLTCMKSSCPRIASKNVPEVLVAKVGIDFILVAIYANLYQ